MWKALLVGTAAVAIVGTSLVYAQPRDNAPARWRPSQEDRAAFTDARIAALKAGLRLAPEQEKHWPAFEAALRDLAKARLEHAPRHNEPRSGDANNADRQANLGSVENLRRHADALTAAGANLKRLADAQEPLYQSLDDSQKNRFQLLSRILSSGHRHFTEMRGRGGRGMYRHHERHHDGDSGRRGRGRGADDRNRGMGTGEQL